jgi:serine/threonine-protein kinase
MTASDESKDRVSLPPVGAVLGERFLLTKKLAAGGIGAVYEAKDDLTGRDVAVKVLHPEFTSDPDIHRRFRRESSILTALEHPGVVKLLSVGTDDEGRAFMAMELLSGETLQSAMAREKRLTPAALMPIVEGVCDALGAVHDHGVVHGDLKPSNIFLTSTGSGVKLVDFGLSKVAGLDRLTRTGEVIGTPAFMAPELLTGEREPDGRADTYALGVILYQALAGTAPFVEKNPGKLMFDIVMGKQVPLEESAPGVASEVAAVVMKAMAAAYDARYEDPRELSRDFRAASGL